MEYSISHKNAKNVALETVKGTLIFSMRAEMRRGLALLDLN